MELRYIATVVLHALGDTIGFKNGDWEFNYDEKVVTLSTTNELMYEFIALGGINEINLENWTVSDDTIINMAMIKGILNSKKEVTEEMMINIKTELVNAYNKIHEDEKIGIKRFPGVATNKYIRKFEEGHDGRDLPYDKMSGGNGAAMRTSCIGLAYYGMEKRDVLIKAAIETSRLTHNSAIGYLGGLAVAYFTALAIEGIDIEEWPFLLIKLLSSSKVKSFIKTDEEGEDHEIYINYWQKYIDTRFENNKPIVSRAQANLVYRTKYHFENFTKDTASTFIGENGYSGPIMAYDSLLDGRYAWEKVIIYSALHSGDSDTVAAIAGSWYGAIYGFGDVPEKNLRYLEFKGELENLGKLLYSKYYLDI